MRRVCAVAICVLAALTISARQKVDVSGAWIASGDATAGVPGAPGPILGPRLWLRQTGDTLTIVRPVRDTVIATTLPLDGREVRTRVPGGVCQGDTQSLESAVWDGNAIALSLVGVIPAGGGPPARLNARRVMRLQSPDVLIVEASMRDASRGAMRPVATVYKRASDPEPTPLSRSAEGNSPPTIDRVGWIAGTWIGASGTTTVEERWTPAAGGALLGVGRTLRNGSMVSFEFLCIAERQGGLVYTAMPNARTPATDFMSTTVSAGSVTFENPAHDFPKLIRYARLADGSLETTVGGDAEQKPQVIVLTKQP